MAMTTHIGIHAAKDSRGDMRIQVEVSGPSTWAPLRRDAVGRSPSTHPRRSWTPSTRSIQRPSGLPARPGLPPGLPRPNAACR
jgi:hypothetical protein